MAENSHHQSNIETARDLLSPYLDGEVSEEERILVETTLATSPELGQELESLRQTIAQVAALPRMAAPRPFTLSEADVGIATPASKRLFGLPLWLNGLAGLTAAMVCVVVLGWVLLSQQAGNGQQSIALQAPVLESNADTEDFAAAVAPTDVAPAQEQGLGEEEEAAQEVAQEVAEETVIEEIEEAQALEAASDSVIATEEVEAEKLAIAGEGEERAETSAAEIAVEAEEEAADTAAPAEEEAELVKELVEEDTATEQEALADEAQDGVANGAPQESRVQPESATLSDADAGAAEVGSPPIDDVESTPTALPLPTSTNQGVDLPAEPPEQTQESMASAPGAVGATQPPASTPPTAAAQLAPTSLPIPTSMSVPTATLVPTPTSTPIGRPIRPATLVMSGLTLITLLLVGLTLWLIFRNKSRP